MSRQRVDANWRQIKCRARAKWPLLTDEDLDRAAGRRDVLIGRIQEKYGKGRVEIEKEVDEWYRTV